MSVVAWDGRTVAADRRVTENDVPHLCRKVFRTKHGEILAFVGGFDHGLSLVRWYKSGGNAAKFPKARKADSATLIVFSKTRVYEFDGSPRAMPVSDKFMAWGSGKGPALGAMAMGADARRAVKIAGRYNVNCGMGVTAFRV